MPELNVNGLALPPLLVELIETGRWRQPNDEAMELALPWFEDRLDLLLTVEEMARESGGLRQQSLTDPDFWQTAIATNKPERIDDTSWLDAERAILIAVNREYGSDVAVALDFRTDSVDPRVLGSEWADCNDDTHIHRWRLAADRFSQFVVQLRL